MQVLFKHLKFSIKIILFNIAACVAIALAAAIVYVIKYDDEYGTAPTDIYSTPISGYTCDVPLPAPTPLASIEGTFHMRTTTLHRHHPPETLSAPMRPSKVPFMPSGTRTPIPNATVHKTQPHAQRRDSESA